MYKIAKIKSQISKILNEANMKYTIDARNKKLGRIAGEAAHVLLGKNSPSYKRYKTADVSVEIINASKIDVGIKKMHSKKYIHYTGYHGGLRTTLLQNLIDRKGYGETLKRAVYGMLPANTLRKKRMKRLMISE